MKYAIQPGRNLGDAYVGEFDSLEEAKLAALSLGEMHHVSVTVYQTIGTYKPCFEWVQERNDG